MGTISNVIWLLQWHYARAVALAVHTYRNVTGRWPVCVECGKACDGDPRSHQGPCARDGLVFCSTWCSMSHGRKARPWKTVKSELRTVDGELAAVVESRLPDAFDPNPWRWILYSPEETGTTAEDLDAEAVAKERLRQRPEFRDGRRTIGLWRTVKSALFAANGRQIAQVIRETSPPWPPPRHDPKITTWRWLISRPYETGQVASLQDGQDAVSERLAQREKPLAAEVS